MNIFVVFIVIIGAVLYTGYRIIKGMIYGTIGVGKIVKVKVKKMKKA